MGLSVAVEDKEEKSVSRANLAKERTDLREELWARINGKFGELSTFGSLGEFSVGSIGGILRGLSGGSSNALDRLCRKKVRMKK